MTEIFEYTAPTRTSYQHNEPPRTLAEYLAMPEGAPYYEFINGIAHFMPSPTTYHQRILQCLHRRMDAFVESNALGEVFITPLDVY